MANKVKHLETGETGTLLPGFNSERRGYFYVLWDCGEKSFISRDLVKISPASEVQPDPTKNASKPVWETVIDDMHDRNQLGKAKYGHSLQAFNGRDPLVDAYQESLDHTVYLRQAIIEQESFNNSLSNFLILFEETIVTDKTFPDHRDLYDRLVESYRDLTNVLRVKQIFKSTVFCEED